MNPRTPRPALVLRFLLAATLRAAGALLLSSVPAGAAEMQNPGFEGNAFTMLPGYASQNGGSIQGWTTNDPESVGLVWSAASPFGNNGMIPEGTRAAFIQGRSELNPTILSTTAEGLIPGRSYNVRFRFAARSGTPHRYPLMEVSAGGSSTRFYARETAGAGSFSLPYFTGSIHFTAAAGSETISFSARSPVSVFGNADTAALLDDVTITEQLEAWRVSAWNGDASSGVRASGRHTHAYNLGSGADALINGVTFKGLATTNPVIPGVLTMSGWTNIFPNDTNNLTAAGGGSGTLATSFLFGGAQSLQTIALDGLTPGGVYRLTLFGAGFDSSNAPRTALFSDGGHESLINESAAGNDRGIRIELIYTALSGSRAFHISPTLPDNSFHLYGFSNAALSGEQTITLIDDNSQAYYNQSLGTILDGTGPAFPAPPNDPPGQFPLAPNLSPAQTVLGAWLATPPQFNPFWSPAVREIPKTWLLKTETAMVYPFTAPRGGYSVVRADVRVDNGVFVWLDGQYIGGARDTGEAVADEYTFNLGTIPSGPHHLQILREDQGAANDFSLNVKADDSSTVDIFALPANTLVHGAVELPGSTDRWQFSASPGQQIRFTLINSVSNQLRFILRSPTGFTDLGSLYTPGDLITLTEPGSHELQVINISEGAAGAYSFRMDETERLPLPLGQTVGGTLAGDGQARIYVLDLAGDGGPLDLDVGNSGAGNRLEIYASRGVPPTRRNYEFGDFAGSGSSRRLQIPYATPGQWFFLVYGDAVPMPGTFTILATRRQVSLVGVTPARLSTREGMTLSIQGAGFQPGAVVELTGGDGTVLAAGRVVIDSYNSLTAEFPAADAPAGAYTLVVRQGGQSISLPAAFEVLQPGVAVLDTKLIMPGSLGRHAVATIYVEYANTGNAAMPAPLLILKSSDPDGSDRPILTLDQSRIIQDFWSGTAGLPPGTVNEVFILAGGAQPGVLNPGERFQVPVYFMGLLQPWDYSDSGVEMEIRSWTADDPSAIDWAARKETLRPPTLDTATWDVVYANLTSRLGTTAQYVRMLNDNAKFLGRLGLRVVEVDDLWNFEVQQAYGYSALPVLDEVTDSSVTVPGVTLDLRRRFSSNLRSRQASGLFGRGWFTPWQAYLLTERAGDVIRLVGEGGSARVFSRDTRNSNYFSSAGDTAKIVATGGAYELRDPNGTATRFRTDGKIEYVQDPNGNRVTAAWNGSNQLSTLTHSSGAVLSLTYNGAGLVSGVTNTAGRSVAYTHDGPYLASATTDDGKVTGYTYETAGSIAERHALTSIVRGGTTRAFTWDDRGRLESSSLTGGEQMTLFGYDSAGGVTVSTGGGTTSLFFEHRGLLAKTIDPLGHITSSEFDTELRLKRLVLPTGDTQQYSWCNCGSPTAITDELGHVTRFNYDHPLKKMTQFTDAKGNLTRYDYDAKGNLLDTIYADGSVERLGNYSAPGLPQARTNRRGQAVTLAYTASGKPDRKTFADGSYDDFDYDVRGNLVKVTEHSVTGLDQVTDYTFSPASDGDLLKKVTYPNGRWVEYFHDAHRRRTRMTDSAGGDTRYEYDAAARLWKVRDAADTVLVEYLYDTAGRMLRINKGNGTWTTYLYDTAGQILNLTNHAPGGAPNSRFLYTYDSRGRRTGMDTLDGKWTYAYDATGQLTRAVLDSINPEIPDQDLKYNYDALGNRTSTVLNGVTTLYTANALNQYSEVGGVAHQHDADGNLLSDGERTYVYNVENRLTQVTGPEGITQYEYDGNGSRTATVLNGVRTEYLLDPTGLVNVVADYGSAGTPSIRHIFGRELIAQRNAANEISHLDFDAIGSTAQVTNISGAAVNRYHWTPFGGRLQQEGSVANHFQFIGNFGVSEDVTGLNYMRWRFYLPTTGRFLTPDPIKLQSEDSNLYRYAINDPVQYFDPVGLFAIAYRFTRPDLVLAERIVEEAHEQFVPQITPPQPNPPGTKGDNDDTKTPEAIDPNEKIGPTGHGPQSWIQADSLMPYRINFENLGPGSKDPDGNPYPNPATAPAQRVTVTDPLSASLDWNTFQFTGFGFGDTIVPVPSTSGGGSHFTGTVPMTYNGQTFDVEIEAGLDFSTGVVTVRFQSINPGTSLPPDVLTGFLPPEDGTGRGMGHITYTVRSKADLPTGTAIRNVADIKFDINAVISTDQVDPQDPSKGIDPNKQALVTLDGDAPASSIGVLPATASGREFLVTWGGTDAGAGIAGYDVFYSDNGGDWVLWQSGVTTTSALFQGQTGHTYGFLSVARDHTGNVQATPAAAQATTTVEAIVPVPELRILATLLPDGHTVQTTLTYEVLNGYTHTVEFSNTLAGNPGWQPLPGAPHQTGSVTDSSTSIPRFYRLRRTSSP